MRGKLFSRLQGRGQGKEQASPPLPPPSAPVIQRAWDGDHDFGVSCWQDTPHPSREGPGHQSSVLHYSEEAPSARSAALTTAHVLLRRAACQALG